MSESGGYKLYVELDFSRFSQQMKQIQDMFTNAQKRVSTSMPSQAIQQAGTLSRTVTSGAQQFQQLQKQTSVFDKMKENMGGIFKNTFMLIGIGTGIAAITKLMIESSGILKSTLGLLQTSIMLLLRPIGDFIGLLLRPVMILLLQKFIIPYYQNVAPIMEKYGTIVGQGLADFLNDPLKHLHGVFVNAWILNWPNQAAEKPPSAAPAPLGGGGGGSTPGGSGQGILVNLDRMTENFEESKAQTDAIKRANDQMRQRYDEFLLSLTATTQQGKNTAQVTLTEGIKISDSMHGASNQASKAEDSMVGVAVALAGAGAIAYEAWQKFQRMVVSIPTSVSAVGIPILSNIYNQATGTLTPPAYASSGGGSAGSGSQTVNIAGASQGSQSLAAAILGGSTKYTVKFASGGVIPEHVVGIGTKSGKKYEFGEDGNEVVHRAGGAFRVPAQQNNYFGPFYVTKEVDLRRVIEEVKKAILSSNNRVSIV